MKTRKDLTLRYSITQFLYWAAHTGASSFATAFLLNRGLSSGLVGVLLAAGGLFSCAAQPIMAAKADRTKHSMINHMMLVLTVISSACFLLQLAPSLTPLAAGLLYMTGIWSSDSIIPLLNSLSVAYSQSGYTINYGAARSVGSVASAAASLVLGHLISNFGMSRMIWFLVLFQGLSILVLLRYPKIRTSTLIRRSAESCSVLKFFSRYPYYCLSLLGILFLGMFLSLNENYLIVIMEHFGGNASHVGTALFISSFSTVPVIFFFGKIRKQISDNALLKIAALSFLLRAVLFYFAGNIPTLYAIQLLHTTSYAFLAPTQVFYASTHVHPSDMIKGQAFITAAYALGCSAGNLSGGLLLPFGANAILIAGICMALVGTIVLFLTAHKTDL